MNYWKGFQMRYSQLRAFHAVATRGGFSRAAEALHLTQPAISEQVRKLEQDHDILLFRREKKRVYLTQSGEALLLRTRPFFEIEQQIEEFLSESRAAPDGVLRIIADSAHHVTGALEAFRARFPQVFVTLRTGNTEEVLSALRNYEAEIGVVGSLDQTTDMECHDLGQSPIIAFAAHPVAAALPDCLEVSDLARLPLIFREQGSKTRQKLLDAAARQGVVLRPVVEVDGREAMREVVASGAGVGFVSDSEFGHDNRLKRLPIRDPELTMNETAICLRQRSDVRIIRLFMQLIRRNDAG
ncbi:MAG: aminoethylphosphonate catabolism LysR family transcriptional regulator [Pseudorhodobacter sp.]|jgi:aminoethylphosphonate catabolism LysR family transcriptional regulator